MKNYRIHSSASRKILYEGRFASFRKCLEQAVQEKTRLEGARLVNKNLTNAMLDDGLLAQADFSGSNLTGANLSEADLKGASFNNVDLYNVCFVGADMRGARFEGAVFGGTDIAGCDISHTVFSTVSSFTLDFMQTRKMRDVVFLNPDGQALTMSAPPVVIKGLLNQCIVVSEQWIKIGPALMRNPLRDSLAAAQRYRA